MNERALPGEPAHPSALKYVQIAVLLAILTTIEVVAVYVEAVHPILVPLLLVLSASKFALVVMFYMHLRFDARLFSGLFVFGLLIASGIILALLALFASHG